MSGMRTSDVVVGDGSWNLRIFVTDLQVKTQKIKQIFVSSIDI